jgi:Carboxypeptidase regulatory-like domain/TonB dependent receptor
MQVRQTREYLRPITALVFLIGCITIQPRVAQAQQASAAINGVVYDSTGAAVPSAELKLANVDTSVVRSATSSASGEYVFLNVTPGNYTIEVTKTGFSTLTQAQVTLEVNQTATFDFHLQVGQSQQTVTVSATSVGVEASTSELGTVISTKQVDDLPLNGRNFTELLLLTPGAAPSGLDQTNTGGNGFVGNVLGEFSFPAVDGQRVRSNTFLLDGTNNLNTFLSTYNYQPIIDAIQEFKVQSHNDDSEYGGVVGGITNVVSKSGTNSYHGDAWEFLRNSSLDANNYFNKIVTPIIPRNPLKQNVFGATVGGPVSIPKLYNGKDKTFFFAAFEAYRVRETAQNQQAVVASPAMRGGDFGAICVKGFNLAGVCQDTTTDPSGNVVTNNQLYNPYSTVTDPQNPTRITRSPIPFNNIAACTTCGAGGGPLLNPASVAAQKIFPVGTPDPNLPPFYIAFPAGEEVINQFEGQIRVDQYFGSKDQIVGRYAQYHQNFDTPIGVVNTESANIYGYNYTIQWSHVFGPKSILDLHFGRNFGNDILGYAIPNQAAFTQSLIAAGFNQTALTTPTGLGGPAVLYPAISISGYAGLNINQYQATGLADTYEVGGNYTRTIGRHIVKIGASLLTNGFVSPINGVQTGFATPATAGVGLNANSGEEIGVGGNAWASFLVGVPDNAESRQVNETTHGGYSDAIYAHDQWKVNNKLTVNVGVRYDLKLWPIYGSGNGANLYTGEPIPTNGTYILNKLPPTCSATQGPPCIPSGSFVNCGVSPLYPAQQCNPDGTTTPYSGLPPHVLVTPNKNTNILNNDFKNWAGRVSFAYRATDKTAIRAGYGRFYDTWGAAVQDAQNFNGNWPYVGQQLTGLNPGFPTSTITNPFNIGTSGGGSVVYPTPTPYASGTWSVDPNYKTPYSDQFNFGIQQELPGKILLDMNYVGALSRRLDVTDVLNVAPTPAGAGVALTPAEAIAREPFPYMANPWFQQSIGKSSYDALQISVNKRATHDVSFLVAYTWSKEIDNGCSADIGAGCSIQNVYNLHGERSVGQINFPQVFSAAFTLNSPYSKDFSTGNRFADAAVGGWALNGIVRLNSGEQYNVGAPAGIPGICSCSNTERADLVGTSTKGPQTATEWFNTAAYAVPTVGTFGTEPRNDLRADFNKDFDLSLFRSFHIGLGESRYFQFRADAFNLLNNVVFSEPSGTTVGATGFGQVTTTANNPRILQIALKFYY